MKTNCKLPALVAFFMLLLPFFAFSQIFPEKTADAPPTDFLKNQTRAGAKFLSADILPEGIQIANPALGQCDRFGILRCGDSLVNQTTVGKGNDFGKTDYSCLGSKLTNWAAADTLYKVIVTQKSNVKIILHVLDQNRDLDMVLFNSNNGCPSTCKAAMITYNVDLGVYKEIIEVNLDPGEYWLVVDGLYTNGLFMEGAFTLSMKCTCTCSEPPTDMPNGEKLYCDNFELYELDKDLAPQASRWEERDSEENGASFWSGDAQIRNFGGSRRAHFKGGTSTQVYPDVLYHMSESNTNYSEGFTTGRYRMSWDMFVPTGKKAYFQVLRIRPEHNGSGGEYGYRGVFDKNGVGKLERPAGGTFAFFNYPMNTWFRITNIVDLSTNDVEVWINDEFVGAWEYSISQLVRKVASIQFLAEPGYEFYIDNLCVWKKNQPNCGGPVSNGAVCIEGNGIKYANETDARCNLYTSREWEICNTVCNFSGLLIYRSDTYDGFFGSSELAPSTLRNIQCVKDAYGGTIPNPLYYHAYVFTRDDNLAVQINWDNNGNPNTKCFVFNCQSGPSCTFGQNCVATCPPNQVTDIPINSCDDTYYIVITGTTPGAGYDNLNIIPSGDCPTNPDILTCGTTNLSGAVSTTGNPKFSKGGGAYADCYTSGPRAYDGGEKVYKITVERLSSVGIQLNSSSPMGMFLYNHICGNRCIGYAETSASNPTADLISPPLSPGIYYLVVDKATASGPTGFSISMACVTVIFNICDCCGSNREEGRMTDHQVGIQQNAAPPGEVFTVNDKIKVSHPDLDGLPSENNVLNWMTPTFIIPLREDDLAGDPNEKCGFRLGDTMFWASVTPAPNFYTQQYKAEYFPPNADIPDQGRFRPGGKSLITRLIKDGPVYNYRLEKPSADLDPNETTVENGVFGGLSKWTVSVLRATPNWNIAINPANSERNGAFTVTLDPQPNTDAGYFPREAVLRIDLSDDLTKPERLVTLLFTIRQRGRCPNTTTVNISASDSEVCSGEQFTLTANPTPNVPDLFDYLWSTGETTQSITAQHTVSAVETKPYAVTITSKFKENCSQAVATNSASVTVNPLPNPPTGPLSQAICQGAISLPAPLSVSSVSAPLSVRWFETQNSSNQLGTGNQFTPNPLPNETTDYFAEIFNTSTGCSSSRIPVRLTINPRPAQPGATPPKTVCEGLPVTLEVTLGPGETASWTGPSGNLLPGNSAQLAFNPATLADNGNYLVEARSAAGCVSQNKAVVSLSVNPKPQLTPGNAACAPNFQTYNVPILTNVSNVSSSPSGTFSNSTIVNVTTGTDVVITATSPQGCTSTASVKSPICTCPPVGNPISGGDKTVCAMTLPAFYPSLSASVTQPGLEEIIWFDQASGGNQVAAIPTFQPPQAKTYYAQARRLDNNLCLSSGRTAVTLSEIPLPSLIVGQPVCAPNLQSWSVNVTTSGNQLTPFNIYNGGSNYTIPNIQVGTTLNLQATNTATGCSNSATVQSPACPCPTVNAPSFANNTVRVCQGSPVPALTANVSNPGTETVNWYDAGGNPIAGAQGVLSFVPSGQGQFFAEAVNTVNGCKSQTKTSISLIVNSLPTLNVDTTKCSPDLKNYTVILSSNGSVTSTAGNVSGSGAFTVSDIPIGTNVTLTASLADGGLTCTSQKFLTAPICTCPPINKPTSDGDGFVCEGATNFPLLSVTVDNPQTETADWFDSQSSTTPLNTQGTLTFQSDGVKTYFVRTRSLLANQCVSSERTQVSVIQNPAPTLIINTNPGGDVKCDPSLQTYRIKLQTNATTQPQAQGNLVIQNSPGVYTVLNIPVGTDVTITVRFAGTNCQTQMLVKSPVCDCPNLPPPIFLKNEEICQGVQTPTLAVDLPDPTTQTVDWYDHPTAGDLLAFETETYKPSLPGDYYAQTRERASNCISATRTKVTYSVSTPPQIEAGPNVTVCEGQEILLDGSIGNNVGGSWSTSQSGGQFLNDPNTPSGVRYLPPPGATFAVLTLTSDDPPGACLEVSDQLVVSINPAPVIGVDSVFCTPDFSQYNVIFHSSTDDVKPSSGDLNKLATGIFQVSKINKGQNLTITATALLTKCTTLLSVNSPVNCTCPAVAQPTDLGDQSACEDATILPQLIVTPPPGKTVNWYASPSGGAILNGGNGTPQFLPPGEGCFFAETFDPQTLCTSSERTEVCLILHPLPVANAGPDKEMCPGGSATLTASAAPGLSYLWTGNLDGQNITVSPPQSAIFSLTVTDANDCTDTDQATVEVVKPLLGKIFLDDDVDCHDDANGSLFLNASDGAGGYSVVWSNGATTFAIENLPGGIYTAFVSDSIGCRDTATYNLPNPPALEIDTVFITNTPAGQGLGFIQIVMQGGTGALKYQWFQIQNGQQTPVPNGTSSSVSSLQPGEYFVKITDAKDCMFSSDTFSVKTIGTAEPAWASRLQLWPNPTGGKIFLQLDLPPSSGQAILSLSDATGRQVWDERPMVFQKEELDLSALPPGAYWLKISILGEAVARMVVLK